MPQAKDCYLNLPSGTQDYIRFGSGLKTPAINNYNPTIGGIQE